MVIEKVIAFLQSDPEVKEKWDDKVTHDTHLIDAGVIDSFAIIKLIMFLEEEFNIKLESNELVENNFSTLKNIEKLVIEKNNQK
ncbi:acyl carrier protein [Candidatus Woesearchaeota archaeon]|nr:acyl carrier protein [Candidatus Woesearchaeota archaeon]